MLKENLKKDYIQTGAIYEITFFGFLVSSNTLCLQQQKSLFLTAADSFQHNTLHLQNSSQYLFNKHCTGNNFMHSKATNNKQTERGGKNSTLTFHFISFLAWITDNLPSLYVFGPL
jgi:hypothetical protein